MEFTSEVLNKLAEDLAPFFANKLEVERAIADLKKPASPDYAANHFSLSKAVRGLRFMASPGAPIDRTTAAEDAEYATRALATSATPGSYLLPTIQSQQVIDQLGTWGIFRKMGPTIWPMPGIKVMTVTVEGAGTTVQWLGENTQSTASDITLTQITFNLKTARALSAISNEMLKFSSPQVDAIITRKLAKDFALAEDTVFFATSNTSNGPGSVYAASSTTTLNAAGNATSGGNLVYGDIPATLAAAFTAGVSGPLVWAMHPRTFFTRLFGLIDLQSRPIVIPDVLGGVASYRLFGYPVFLSENIPIDQAVVSGTNQSYALLTNPSYLHIGESNQLEIAISTERYFDYNQTAIRGVHEVDFKYSPAAGITLLKGIN